MFHLITNIHQCCLGTSWDITIIVQLRQPKKVVYLQCVSWMKVSQSCIYSYVVQVQLSLKTLRVVICKKLPPSLFEISVLIKPPALD